MSPITSSTAEKSLVQSLTNEYESTGLRIAAAEALGEMRYTGPELLVVMQTGTENTELRAAAARALGRVFKAKA